MFHGFSLTSKNSILKWNFSITVIRFTFTTNNYNTNIILIDVNRNSIFYVFLCCVTV